VIGDRLECRFHVGGGRHLRRRRLGGVTRADASLRPTEPSQVEAGSEDKSAQERDDDRRAEPCP